MLFLVKKNSVILYSEMMAITVCFLQVSQHNTQPVLQQIIFQQVSSQTAAAVQNAYWYFSDVLHQLHSTISPLIFHFHNG